MRSGLDSRLPNLGRGLPSTSYNMEDLYASLDEAELPNMDELRHDPFFADAMERCMCRMGGGMK